jgi:RNA polymerase sigma-70 factor, ECF subfamily
VHALPDDQAAEPAEPDAALVRRCVAREPAAWDEFVHRHVPVLSSCVRRVLGLSGAADVEDVLQAVFLKLWDDDCRRLRTFRGRSRLSTWLVVLARREALDRVRARRSRRETVSPAAMEGEPASPAAGGRNGAAAASSTAEDRDERARLLAAVDALPARERLLVRLVWMDGCAYADAARLLAVPENSISPWLLRARGRLRAALGTADGERAYGTPPAVPPTERSETP